MNLDEAKVFLSGCERWELRDHAFGDMECGWTKDGEEVATGYFGGRLDGIDIKVGDEYVSFTGREAGELLICGTLGEVGRNDETGPDAFEVGKTMPGLTKEGVLEELTGEG